MLTDSELNRLALKIVNRIDEVNALYIRRVAEQIKAIGELNASSVNILNIMADMGANVDEITRKLSEATALTVRDVMQLYQQALDDATASPDFTRYVERQQEREIAPIRQPPDGKQPTALDYMSGEERQRVTNYAQAISRQTAAKLVNLSNTTAIEQPYKNAIDTAVTAVSQGLQDYQSATRDVVEQIGYGGLQVYYESGYHRRLDTAVRQNIIDGAKQIAQQTAFMVGEAIGCDAYEISAHGMSAPDHEPVQGHIFLKAEFEKMQNEQDCRDIDGRFYQAFRRPIAEWNCGHFAYPVHSYFGVRTYTDKQLEAMKRQNEKGCTVAGKHFTKYEASQYMRTLETEVRRWKDAGNAAKAAGDMEERRKCQRKINHRRRTYEAVAAAAGIKSRPERMRVAGYRRVRV